MLTSGQLRMNGHVRLVVYAATRAQSATVQGKYDVYPFTLSLLS